MKKTIVIGSALCLFIIQACKKDTKTVSQTETPTPAVVDNYTSLSDFYSQNGVQKETFTLNAGTGGNFVSAQGSTINIPANTFTPSTATIVIEFKDIYTKSDMLLSNMATNLVGGAPLVSAGEFFIKALNNNVAVDIAASKKIDVLQPFKQVVDRDISAFIAVQDSTLIKAAQQASLAAWQASVAAWQASPAGIMANPSNYVFSLYQFGNPFANGTWCNSDNSKYFSAYPQTTLTIHPNQFSKSIDVFLVFKINSMVHVYLASDNNFVYHYAPVGLDCSIVGVDVKAGKLYSSFTPIKISANQTVNIDLHETTAENFKTTLKALN